MSYKQRSPLPIVEGGTGTQLFEMAVGKQGFGVILSGQFSTSPLEVIQDPGTVGQVLTSNGISVLPTFQSISSIGAVIELTGDTGGAILPTAGNINILAGLSSQHSGSTVSFSGSGSTLEFNVTDANFNTIIGIGSGNASITGNNNTVLGSDSAVLFTSGIGNTFVGNQVAPKITTGGANTFLGLLTGFNYTGNENNNILIGYSTEGTIGETNTLRIGNGTGSSPTGEIAQTFISGISGVNVGSVATVVTESGDQLGTAVITAGTGITITPGANTITIAADGSGVLETLTGDTGGAISPTAGNINIISGLSTINSGSTVLFAGSASTIEFNVTDANANTIIGQGAGNATISGTNNTILGSDAGVLLTIGIGNTIVGSLAAPKITTGGANTFIGVLTGFNYTGIENNNILIGYSVEGTVGETNTLRIGNGTGSAPTGEIAQTFISGIDGVNVGSTATVVTEAGNQLGTAVITAGTGITVTPGANTITISANSSAVVETLTGDIGGAISPSSGNINIIAGVSSQNSGSSVLFSGSGNTIEFDVTDANANTIIGQGSGNATITGTNNTILGSDAGVMLTIGIGNTIVGSLAAPKITTGGANTFLGVLTGFNYTGIENNNILIGYSVEGTVGETNTLRIGNGTGSAPTGEIAQTFISGISGVNVGSVATIVTEASNQLGTAVLTAGTGITITPGANTITIAANSSAVVETLTGDTGGAISPSAGNINVIAGLSSQHSGSTVSFSGSGNTIELNVSDANVNTIVGVGSGNASVSGTNNTVFGSDSAVLLTTGIGNTLIGSQVAPKITTGGANTLLGVLAGFNYTGNENNNILIGYSTEGTIGETNTLRIGNGTGSAPTGQIAQTFISGISGVNVGSVATVVTESGDKLGTAVITAGTGITVTPGANTITISANSSAIVETLTGDSGGAISPSAGNINVITGVSSQNSGSSISFVGSGSTLELNVTDANTNTIIGQSSGNATVTGSGFTNAILGAASGTHLTTGSANTMIGYSCGQTFTTGTNNTLLGVGTGSNYLTSESYNVLIGSNVTGTAAESHTLRIGNGTGTGANQLNKAVICGIDGINVGSTATVVTESGNQLGTAVITAGSGITVTPGANTITIAASGGGGVTITTFTMSGTWTKAAGTKFVTVLGWAGGGSGGSGRQGTSAASSGGSGGGGSGFFQVSNPASFFGATETVTIAAGGTPPGGQTSPNTNGIAGNVGGNTAFGNILLVGSNGGKAGTTGTVTGGTGSPSYTNYAGSVNTLVGGASTVTTGSVGAAVTIIANSACGGSGGGGSGADVVTARQAGAGALMKDANGTTILAGGAGGIEGGTIDGTIGNDQLSTGGVMIGGTGGGGGGGQSTGLVAGKGGKGGFPGGGGGGGGASITGTTSGDGGAGGDGQVIVIEFA